MMCWSVYCWDYHCLGGSSCLTPKYVAARSSIEEGVPSEFSMAKVRLLELHIASIVFASLLLIGSSAWAQLSLSPNIIQEKVYAGGLATFTVSVGNTDDRTLVCTMDVWALEIRGGLPVPVEDAPRSCREWLTVEPETFTLSPKGGRRVVCRLQAPRETGGGYYAVLSCTGVIEESSEEESKAEQGISAAVRLSHRTLAPVLVTVPAPELRAIVEAGEPVLSRGEENRGYVLEVPVRNRGNHHARIGGTVEVRSEADQLIERFELAAGRGFVLPEHERLFRSRGTVNLPDGIYVAQIRLDVEHSAEPMQHAFPFYIQGGRPTVTEMTDELRTALRKQSAGFAVSPAEILVTLQAGARRTQTVELVNLTRETLRLRAHLTEWIRDSEGRDTVSEKPAFHKRSGRSLVTLRQPEIELRPLSRRRVPLMISLSKEATGEFYVAVTFDREDIQLDASPEGLARRSVMVRMWAQGTGVPAAQVTRWTADRQTNGIVEFSANVRNIGNVGIVPEGSISILDAQNRTVGRVRLPPDLPFVQAGGEGSLAAEWSQVLDSGTYTAQLTFRFDPSEPPIVKKTSFVVPKPR